jgi:capsular exopolysaccharide synthesis family protein
MAFVEERLKYVEKDLDSIEQKLQQYKSRQGAIDISSQGTLFLENVSALSQRIGDVNVQMDVLNQVENYVTAKDKSGGIVPSTVGVNDPLLTKLVNDLYENELKYDNLIKTTGTNNPMAQSIKNEIDKMRPSILENIRSQKSGLQASRSNLNSLNNRFSSQLSSIPQKERDLVEISRQQSIKSSVYNFLLQKKEETAMALTASVADSRIVDRALAIGPISPGSKIYIMATLLALVLGVGLVTANELLKRTILFRHEIEAFTSVPVIGEIVHDKSGEAIVIGNGKRTFIAEQFRNLRTSLPYLGIKGDKRKLLVTSTTSGEGKSFVVANLAMSLAMAGKKVIVLEFDLSEPTLCLKLNFTNINKGITDYLNGEAEPEEVIRRTQINENLFIMPAGTNLPDNPSELIMNEKVPELLQYLSDIFDYIIVDSAPVGLLTDAYILSSYCDATLYVIRHRHTRKVSIQRLDENNKINELKNIAIVFNGVKSRGFSNNGYGYGYGYGYLTPEKRDKKRVKKEKV